MKIGHKQLNWHFDPIDAATYYCCNCGAELRASGYRKAVWGAAVVAACSPDCEREFEKPGVVAMWPPTLPDAIGQRDRLTLVMTRVILKMDDPTDWEKAAIAIDMINHALDDLGKLTNLGPEINQWAEEARFALIAKRERAREVL